MSKIYICNECSDEYNKGGTELFCSMHCKGIWYHKHFSYYDCSHFNRASTPVFDKEIYPILKYPKSDGNYGYIIKWEPLYV